MKIYHNTNCSKSCGALNLLHDLDEKPQVIEYLLHPFSKSELSDILLMLDMKPLDLIRKNEPVFQEKYASGNFTDEQWIDIMLENPILIERPIVVKNGKAIIALPIELIKNFIEK